MTDSRPSPRATYRLQLHKEFRFDDVARLAPYLGALGVSHAYLSPILMARAGSMHGYDTVDHLRINPELGTIDDFRAMAAALRRSGVGIILDIVPNHMGIGGHQNPYWLDVLERGQASRYAEWFDIDWAPAAPGLDGRILAPFLDRSYGRALDEGLLELRLDESDGSVALWLPGEHKLPLAPETYVSGDVERVGFLNSESGRQDLHDLLQRQHWRVAKFTTASDEINYRRFFAISDLAGIRIERPDVFHQVHQLVFQLIDEGWVDGLRIDHIDGLRDPEAYCLALREKSPRPIYIVVEKILGEGERLPESWQVDGTTGYEFAALVNPLLVDPEGEARLSGFYHELTGSEARPTDIEWRSKGEVMETDLAAELDALSWKLAGLAGQQLTARDLTRLALKRGLRAFIAGMPVYRTYIDAAGARGVDREIIAAAMEAARRREPNLDDDVLAFIRMVLLAPEATADREQAVNIALRVQQFSGPVMAKGLEDTALYRFNRLIAVNDVGERPEPFSLPVEAFHAATAERARIAPHSMLGTSSHDSKRGEDARARIGALSGHADAWTAAVPRWLQLLHDRGAPAIAADDAYLFFQLLLGAWTGSTTTAFADRLVAAMQKSIREAAVRTNWIAPDSEYEANVEALVRMALTDASYNEFLADFSLFEAALARHGALAGLLETTLKLTVPGVPDIYQGAEFWEQSLVDPDNRRPVDFEVRQKTLESSVGQPVEALLPHWRDGAVKQALIARLLAYRTAHAALFDAGSYEPIRDPAWDTEGICAFWRRHGNERLLVAVRLYPWRAKTSADRPLRFGSLDVTDLVDVLAPARGAAGDALGFPGDLPIVVLGTP